MVVDDPQYPGQPFLPVIYWSFYFLDPLKPRLDCENPRRVVIFHAQDPMPKSFGEWLTTFTQVQKVPGATGLWCRAFLLCGGQHNDCRHEMGPIWRESNKQLEWMVILEGFSLKVHCWGWQYRDPEKWGWFIYIPIWYGAIVGVKLGSRPLACTFQFVFRGREAMLAPLLLC